MSHIQFYMFQMYLLYIVFIKEENKYILTNSHYTLTFKQDHMVQYFHNL